MLKNTQSVPFSKNGFGLQYSPQEHEFGVYQTPNARIRWGSVTKCLGSRPETLHDVRPQIRPMEFAPRPSDVMIAEVQFIGRHTGIELDSGRKSIFQKGDLLAVAFGHRYATAQFHGEVPGLCDEYHMLSQGGVCGRVISAPPDFLEPTILKPLGYLVDEKGVTVNLRTYSKKAQAPVQHLPPIILVVGSSMDAGKTIAASAVIRGLSRNRLHVNGGKLTGTACVKDLSRMYDAGAIKTLDFTSLGFASTSLVTELDLQEILDVMISHLAADSPDYLVLEIADGVIQRETTMLLSMMKDQNLIQFLVLAVHDVMAAPGCIELLSENWGITPTVVSGAATLSPLSVSELEQMTDCVCRSREQLQIPAVAQLFKREAVSGGTRFENNGTVVNG